jgi:phosphatidylglycerophosphate synthase
VAGLLSQVLLLTALAATVGLTARGWGVGLACGVVTAAVLSRGMTVQSRRQLGPADRVTLSRVVVAGGVAALTVDSFGHALVRPVLVVLAAVALALDGVDGWVARRTGTVSHLGARFDLEADAFLILVLSVLVARTNGVWVIALGGARYLFVAAGWTAPWLRGALPMRYWRKVVAATQGVVLTVVASSLLPSWLALTALLGAAALLAESFGRDVWWLWCRRDGRREERRDQDPIGALTTAPTTALSASLTCPPTPTRASDG